MSADALSLVFSSTTAGGEDLFRATRTQRGSVFSAAAPLVALNTAALEGTPFLSASGLHLYFQSNRAGGVGSRDLYVAERVAPDLEFENPRLLANVNSATNDHYPRLAPDELTLSLTSSRAGGEGQSDLWTATRTEVTGDFEDLTPLAEINGPANDESGTLTSDGLALFFNSDRDGGRGAFDIYIATRDDPQAPFSEPMNLTELNSSSIDFNVVLTRDERELFFASNRGGGAVHVYRAALICP